MIQRVQSIFLAVIAILMAACTGFNYWQKAALDGSSKIYLSAIGKAVFEQGNEAASLQYFPFTFVAILALLSCGLAIYEIFQYKNRLLQLKLGALNSLFMGATLVLMVVFINQNEDLLDPGKRVLPGIAFYMPVIAMVLNIIANRFIRKDEKLVRSADRMR
ncbi:DUF4293 domain-containing protein [Hyphobacterium sp. CCMP332]|nr:DUF4293 domain-containing protein [Hyphobacterium sp. CCMP332]